MLCAMLTQAVNPYGALCRSGSLWDLLKKSSDISNRSPRKTVFLYKLLYCESALVFRSVSMPRSPLFLWLLLQLE